MGFEIIVKFLWSAMAGSPGIVWVLLVAFLPTVFAQGLGMDSNTSSQQSTLSSILNRG